VVLDFYRRCGSQTVGEAADEGDVDDEVVLERVEDDDERAERRQKEAEEEGRMIDLTDDVSPVASLRRLVGRCSAGLHLRLRTSATRILAPSFAHPHANRPSRRMFLDMLPHACTPSHPAPHCGHTRLNTRRSDTPALSLALMNILFFSPSPLSPCTLLTTADFICATSCTSAALSQQTQHTPHQAHTALYSAPEHAVSFTRPASTVLLTTTAIICAHELHISRVVKAEPGTKINVKDEVIAIDEDEVRETVPGTPETVDWDPDNDNDNDAITVSDDIIVMDSQEEEVSQQPALSGPSKCQPEYAPSASASAAASEARTSAVSAASASASASASAASAAASVAAAVPPRVLPAALSRKNSYVALLERKGPQRIGERALPVGSAGCLEGLRFVVTGVRAHPPTSRVCTASAPTSPRT
jgi:hypothetical protein